MEFKNNNFTELNTSDMKTIDGGVNWDAVGGTAAVGGGSALGAYAGLKIGATVGSIGGPAGSAIGGIVGGIAGAVIYYLWD